MTPFQRRVLSTTTRLIISGSFRSGPRFLMKTTKIGWFFFLLGMAASGFGLWLSVHAITPSVGYAVITQDDRADVTLALLAGGLGGLVLAGFGLFVVVLSKLMNWLTR